MEIKESQDLLKLFYKYKHRILYTGSDFKYLSYKGQNVLNSKWTCMILADEKAKEYISESDRSISYISNPDKFQFNFTQKKPVAISLNTVDSKEKNFLDYQKKVNGYFDIISKANNLTSLFCIAGITKDNLNNNKYERIALVNFLKRLNGSVPELRNGAIVIFQYDEIRDFVYDAVTETTVDELCQYLENNENCIIKQNERIEDFFDYIPDEEDYDDVDYSNSADFFIDGKLKSIDRSFVSSVSDTMLLSEEVIYEDIDKIKKYNISRYFYNFLRYSYRKPIWYGYEKDFYIKRACNDKIINSVKKALKKHDDQKVNKPICIYGTSGSGKSLTAGYVAYTIYKTFEYPVLYINKSRTNFSTHGDRFFVDQLKKLLDEIENKGNNPCLIVLDLSGYERIHVDNLFKVGVRRFFCKGLRKKLCR